MPLRSVEAATRDDAIAAAREQFGPSARVVGVRRVRSGGVLGFFATERYVAEVAADAGPGTARPAAGPSSFPAAALGPDPAQRPVAERATAAAQALRDLLPDDGPDAVSELAGLLGHTSSSPSLGTYTPASVSRTTSARPFETKAPAPVAEPVRFSPARTPRAATTLAPATPAPANPAPATSVAALLKAAGAAAPEPVAPREDVAPSRVRRGAAAAPAPWTVAAARAAEDRATAGDDETSDAPATGASPSPSPFTAALARMVAGDRDVRQAVQQALDDRAADAAPGIPTGSPRPASARPAATPPEHQEEEPVTEQDTMAPFPTADEARSWDEPAASAVSSREEAIAEVLRAALAQGHSDEALTGILRKVLDGVPPRAALTGEIPVITDDAPYAEPPVVAAEPISFADPVAVAEPVASAEPVAFPEPLLDSFPVEESVPALVEASFDAPVETFVDTYLEAPVELPVELPAYAEPVAETAVEPAQPLAAQEVVVEAPAAQEEPAWSYASTLWGEPVRAEVVAPEAEVVVPEPAVVEPTVAEVAPEVAAELAVGEPTVAVDVAEPEQAAVAEATVAEAVAEEVVVEEAVVEEAVVEEAAPVLAELARTASDPAPMPLDATTVMPPLSLLPPLPGGSRRSSGRPPVPPPSSSRPPVPASRPAAAAAARQEPAEIPAPVATLATVVRLPVAMLEESVDEPAESPAPEAAATAREVVDTPSPAEGQVPATDAALAERPTDLAGRLRALGVPELLLGAAFVAEAATTGTYAALTRVLAAGLPAAPEVPTGAGEVLFVVGPGVETLRGARALAASLRLDPDRVQWATRGELAALAPKAGRMTTIDAAIDRRQDAAGSGMPTIVAVDAPLRGDTYWMSQMLAIWTPAAVWAVVDATRKPEDVEPWLAGLPRVDALMVQDSDLSANPAAVLDRIAVPVALLDGVPATPHRWASVLCERLEKQQG